MAKKKKSKANNPSFAKYFKYTFLFLFLFSIGFLAYDMNRENVNTNSTSKDIKKVKKPYQKDKEKRIVDVIHNNLNTDFNTLYANLNIQDKECKPTQPSCKQKEKSVFSEKAKVINEIKKENTKAKLTIIIDDVAIKTESDEIKAIIKTGKLITPSFFPNTSNHPDTHILAKDFKHYMVHLPLEAMNYAKEEPKTLHVGDSYGIIKNRIDDIKKSFPNLVFINNHTGSKFTSDEESLRMLFKAMKLHNLIFVDSRTIASTKAPKLSLEFNQRYIHRDVFLDNVANVDEIKKSLEKAVKLAIKNGRAIAIGHPHKQTLQAIREFDFSKVDLVSVDEIYNKY